MQVGVKSGGGGDGIQRTKMGTMWLSRRQTLYFSNKLGHYKLIAILPSEKHFPQMIRYFTCRALRY